MCPSSLSYGHDLMATLGCTDIIKFACIMCFAVKRTYTIVGLQKKRHQFTHLSIINFSQLQAAVKDRWHFFRTVEFNVYTERAVQESNKAKGSADFQPLHGNELNEVIDGDWVAMLGSCLGVAKACHRRAARHHRMPNTSDQPVARICHALQVGQRQQVVCVCRGLGPPHINCEAGHNMFSCGKGRCG